MTGIVRMHLLVVLALGVTHVTHAMPEFRFRIPNGESVPNPCLPSEIWAGVGHLNKEGGGQLNPFGEDFKQQNFQWTKTLCEADSDNDGSTNGNELGDPNCEWSVGQTPSRVTDITHPGFPTGSCN